MKKRLFTEHICILVSNEMKEKIFQVTDSKEISVSEYLRSAVQEKLERENAQEPKSIKEESESF